MGILAQRKSRNSRRTISRDPNNSKWMRDTSNYGQKIMRAQGWESGQLLGAQNMATSKLHSQASAACIRVTLKDDLRGLGYNQATKDRVTGLDVFSDVLSRLNGKSEEDVAKKKQERLVLQSNMYLQQKWGVMRFVRGGVLVGDAPEEEGEEEKDDTTQEERREKSEAVEKVKKSKKRKLGDDADSREEKKKRRKEEKRRAAQDGQESNEDKEMMRPGREGCDQSAETEVTMEERRRTKSKSKDKARRSDDKGESKKMKKKKKKKKKQEEEEEEEKQKGRRKDEAEAEVEVEAETGTESEAPRAMAAETTSVTMMRGHRNFARSRFIAAKRQAMMDAQALNQILMIKT
ncbi:hypothetical protein L249_3392 [Ophiocordyceps polyrhachis-furcata BCC 54312]|uniref:G-patch domain-containing protein n=1 Tax=Ophiocordyceps polyrhachis-furcata BCC 54312 TaxID=1330021 RepID=A0A367LMA8_9HYPO|nr:hypothetical protein L249_3392 [Ophiocordyceps polyrhachis-furcata BCC 54312]